mmetsp:Transcript_10989/g.30134  ORF Transcript_10989/g.30134 Transcript_10989/m.30134 type:complete len:241 (-) Transcript_10989:73-795(-)
MDEAEFVVQGRLQLALLGLRQVKPCEVKHLLAEQLEDLHAILAQGLAGLGGADQVWDESAPFVGPVVLQDLDQDDVELVDEGRLPPEHGLVRGVRDDEVGQEVLDALPLFLGQGTPLEPDDVLQDLQCKVLCSLALRSGQDDIHALPSLRVFLKLKQELFCGNTLLPSPGPVHEGHCGLQERHIQGRVEVQQGDRIRDRDSCRRNCCHGAASAQPVRLYDLQLRQGKPLDSQHATHSQPQ